MEQTYSAESNISYDSAHFSALFSAEDAHFWFQARNHIIGTLVQQLDSEYTAGYRFLEIGCGNGNVLRTLEEVCAHGHVMGMDLFAEGLRYARQRVNVPLVQADIYAMPFRVKFEMLGLFDVLEHLPNDTDVLTQLHAALPPNGALLMTVPAYPSLWSYADELANHKRRYTVESMSSALQDTGFQVTYITHFMMSILPLVWVQRKLANYRIAHTDSPDLGHQIFQDELKITPVVNNVLTSLLKREASFIRRRKPMPFGTSLLVLAHKR